MASKGKPKRASPKVKKTAELYKSSHNIGNRTARMRVGCYADSEFAVEYPDGFWDPVKPPGDGSPDHGGAAVENHAAGKTGAKSGSGGSGGSAKSSPAQAKTSKSTSGAVKRKMEDGPEVNGAVSPPKKAAVKKEKNTPKSASKNAKASTPKSEKITLKKEKAAPKKELLDTPTKEVKIVIEKHPDLENKKKVISKGKGSKEEDKSDAKEKKGKKVKETKTSKEMNGIKEKKTSKKKQAKGKEKPGAQKEKETKPKKGAVKPAKKENDEGDSDDSSDYTYDSDDSDMEISFKKRKTESPMKESPKAKAAKNVTPKGKDKLNDSSGKGRKPAKQPISEERAPRIRRTACLNANAIVSALYQVEDTSSHTKSGSTPGSHSKSSSAAGQRAASPVAAPAAKHAALSKRRKVSIEADLDEGGDEAFDLYLQEYEDLAREGPDKISKSKRPPSSPKKEASAPSKRASSPKKSTPTASAKHGKKHEHKKESSKADSAKKDKKDSAAGGKKDSGSGNKRDGGGSEPSAYDYDSDDDDFGPSPGLYKPLFNRDKSPKKYEIRKVPKSPEREANKKATSINTKKSPGAASDQKKENVTHKRDSVVQTKEPAAQKKETAAAKGNLLSL